MVPNERITPIPGRTNKAGENIAPVSLQRRDYAIIGLVGSLLITVLGGVWWFFSVYAFFDNTRGQMLEAQVKQHVTEASRMMDVQNKLDAKQDRMIEKQSDTLHRIELIQREIGASMGLRRRLERVVPARKETER